ncbi:hypothetical protein [Oryzobacter terrae]|uniref:hypothetical protein n=1 Tax=Oryzobacter terrae TaxID=1620385 RepID=UPI00366E6698
MTHVSTPDLLTLHAVRLLGFAPTDAVAARFALDPVDTEAVLHDASERGWATWSTFLEMAGWSLSTSGRHEGERLLAEELDASGGRGVVEAGHHSFLPLNAVVTGALTGVQLAAEPSLDEQTRDVLLGVGASLGELEDSLTSALGRFAGYRGRFLTALFRADDDPAWLAGTSVDSCHRVWFELHEDLVATLGITR